MKIDSRKIKIVFKKIPRTLASHSFLTFLVFLFASLFLSGIIFYQSVLLLEEVEVSSSKKTLQFDQGNYKETLKQWQKREKDFEKVNSNQYLNPFQENREKLIIPTSTEEVSTSTEEESTTTIEEATTTPEEATSTPEGTPSPLVERLLAAESLSDFYIIRDGRIPLLWERALIWEELGLGSKDSYYGSEYQNKLLLAALKKELTE